MADRVGARSWWLCVSARVGSAAWVAALAAGGGCSASSAPPTAYITTAVGDNPQGGCNFVGSTTQFTLEGTGGSGSQLPALANGDTQGAASVSVACTVSQSGSGFNVSADIELNEGNGGNFTMTGGTWPSTGMATGITISFATQGMPYCGKNCTATYETGVSGGPINSGRVWGSFQCLDMTQCGGQSGTTNVVCEGTGEFQLTNCSE